uniref:Uncharacterized protein n=1 Tax=Aegilops tauschii TaxID=37682 RepID=R7WCZ0_AEGTA
MAKLETEEGGGFIEAQLQELRNAGLVYIDQLWYSFPVQKIKPKKDNTQRNMLVSMMPVQRKIVGLISESRDVLTSEHKSIWWSQ